MDLITGRNIPSFQQLYDEQVDYLKRFFQNSLVDLGNRSAFDTLFGEAWKVEQKALSNLRDLTLLDGLNLSTYSLCGYSSSY